MPLTQLAPPYPIFTDQNGDPLDAGFLYFGVADQNPETNPITVYWDNALTQPAAQPVRTINGYPSRNGSPAAVYTDQYFSITVRNKKNELVIYAPSGYGITPGTSASFTDQITYNEGSAGAVNRVLTSRLQDRVSFKDFGAVGDGVADDTAAIQAAVAYAATNDLILSLAGDYLTTNSIPNLHSIKFEGLGRIIRGSDIFMPNATQSHTNNLYVSTSGVAGNDGLSASEPMLTLSEVLAAHRNYGFLDGTWRTNLAAGTYTGLLNCNQSWTDIPSRNRLEFAGPAQGHPNVPTAIIDGENIAGRYGIQFSERSRGTLTDILYQNMAIFGANAVFGGQLKTVNVHTFNCLTGLRATFQADIDVSGGIIDGNNRASSTGILEIIGVSHRIGVTGTDPSVTGPIIKNCASNGALVAEQCSGHYNVLFEDNVVGVRIDAAARCNFDNTQIKRSTTAAIRATGNSIVHGLTGVDLFTGTVDANARNVILNNGSAETSLNSSRNNYWQEANVSISTHTGTTAETDVRGDLLFPEQFTPVFFSNANGFRFVLLGSKTGSGGTATLRLRAHTSNAVGGTTLSEVVLAAGDTGTFKWEIEGQLRPANQRLSNVLIRDGASPLHEYNAFAVNMEDGNDWWFVLTVELADATDALAMPVYMLNLTR